MYRFYVDNNQIMDENIVITGSDVNHIKNVLRLKQGEKIIICNGHGMDFYCIIENVSGESVDAKILEKCKTASELLTKMYLFQGLPKKDKMELIIQKAVELGVYEIIPVVTKRTIVKIEEGKKEDKKLERWNSIAQSAAKQSGRGFIPNVHKPVKYEEALKIASRLEYILIPFEHAEGINKSKEIIKETSKYSSVGVFIGPEGGFEDSEVYMAQDLGANTITLGKRILRTETAGMTTLSLIMFECEKE